MVRLRLWHVALIVTLLALTTCTSREAEKAEKKPEGAPQESGPTEKQVTPRSAASDKLPEGVFDSLAREIPAERPNPSFRDVTRQSGIFFVHSRGERTSMLPEDMGSGAAWGDYNNDGYPDLYLVNQSGPLQELAQPDASSPGNKLYRNNGNGTFTDVTVAAGVGDHGFGMGTFWGDYDNDGCLDLYVTNYGRSVLYRNNCNGTFNDVTSRAGVANDRWATGATWFDYDRDGWLDLYVCNYVDFEPTALPADPTSLQYGINVPFTLNPASFEPQPNRLYRNNRNGTFADVTQSAGVADDQGRSLVVTFADFDLDGWPDLYIGNDISANSLFRNRGNGRFADISASSATQGRRPGLLPHPLGRPGQRALPEPVQRAGGQRLGKLVLRRRSRYGGRGLDLDERCELGHCLRRL
jgi:hypothetical protein